MKKSHMWVSAILLVGLGLRLITLNQSLWLDEAIEWWGVTAFNLRELLTGYMLGDFNPPGHHILMWFWVRVFGDSEIALRIPSVLFGVGTVWMVYQIGRILERPGLGVRQGQAFIGLTAAALAGVNGLLIYYSQEARMYAMTTFFVTASVWAFLKLQKKFSPPLFIVYCLLLIVALYSHYLAWLMVPVFFIGGMGSVREMGGVRVMRVVRYAIPLLATMPLWPLLAKQLQNGIASAGNSQWAMLSQTTPKNVALVYVKFVTGRVAFPDELIWQVVVGAFIVLFWVGVLRGMREMWGVREQRVIVNWLVVPLVLGGLIGLVIPVFSYFRFLFVLPAALLLFGRGITVRGVREMRVMGGMGVTVFLSFSLLYLLVPSNHRENWKELVSRIYLGKVEAISPFVIIHPAVQPPFDYYDHAGSRIVGLDRKIPNTLWYIPYGQPIFDPEDSTRIALQQKGYIRTLEQHFREVTLEKWEKIPIRLPDRPKFLKL